MAAQEVKCFVSVGAAVFLIESSNRSTPMVISSKSAFLCTWGGGVIPPFPPGTVNETGFVGAQVGYVPLKNLVLVCGGKRFGVGSTTCYYYSLTDPSQVCCEHEHLWKSVECGSKKLVYIADNVG